MPTKRWRRQTLLRRHQRRGRTRRRQEPRKHREKDQESTLCARVSRLRKKEKAAARTSSSRVSLERQVCASRKLRFFFSNAFRRALNFDGLTTATTATAPLALSLSLSLAPSRSLASLSSFPSRTRHRTSFLHSAASRHKLVPFEEKSTAAERETGRERRHWSPLVSHPPPPSRVLPTRNVDGRASSPQWRRGHGCRQHVSSFNFGLVECD